MASYLRSSSSALRARLASPSMTASSLKTTLRPYHATLASRLPYKDTQDRESLNPSGTEGTKTGRDADVARQNPDAAFNPNKTSPEEAQAEGGSELDVSGANHKVSTPRGNEKEPDHYKAGEEIRKSGQSGGRSPSKKGEPHP